MSPRFIFVAAAAPALTVVAVLASLHDVLPRTGATLAHLTRSAAVIAFAIAMAPGAVVGKDVVIVIVACQAAFFVDPMSSTK